MTDSRKTLVAGNQTPTVNKDEEKTVTSSGKTSTPVETTAYAVQATVVTLSMVMATLMDY